MLPKYPLRTFKTAFRLIPRTLLIASVLFGTSPSIYAEPNVFRIGTGGSGGTYFPIGSIIAAAITGTSGHHLGRVYSEPDLVAVAQRSAGSAANVADINDGLLEAGFVQADVVHWAYNGTGPFENEAPRKNLRSLATLYLESVHLVVRKGAGISSIHDLPGKRVSLDEVGSGTYLDVLSILDAFEVKPESLKPAYLKTSDSIERLRNDELDAIFVVAGYPVSAVTQLVAENKSYVIPITGAAINSISSDFPFFSIDDIPSNTYKNSEAISTLGVPAQLIINGDVDDDLVYNITSMLWSNKTMELLGKGHPKGRDIMAETALTGINVPLHPGALRYYREKGLLN